MKRSYSIYSRQWLGFDNRVWLALLATVVLSLVLFGFKMITDAACSSVKLSAKGSVEHKAANVFYVNEEVTFVAQMKHVQSVNWNFGDGSNAKGDSVKHMFTAEGMYSVIVTINDKCQEVPLRIRIRKINTQAAPSGTTTVNAISGPDMMAPGTPQTFTSTADAGTYEWTMEGDPSFKIKTGKTIGYTPSTPGSIVLVLKLDADSSKTFRKAITIGEAGTATSNTGNGQAAITDLPPIPVIKKKDPVVAPQTGGGNDPVSPPPVVNNPPVTPVKKKFTIIPDGEFQLMLNDVVDKKKNMMDFNNYLCRGPETQVMANGKWTTFGELCKKLQDRKGIFNKKVKVKFKRQKLDPDNGNCVLFIEVDYD